MIQRDTAPTGRPTDSDVIEVAAGTATEHGAEIAADVEAAAERGAEVEQTPLTQASLPQSSSSQPPRNTATDIALIAVFAAFIAACSVIAIPIGAAPITLQTFAVLLSGAVLGASRGFFAVLLYLGLGAIGLPVFAGGMAGLAPFAGPTVGYLISFPLAALLTGLLVRAFPRRTITSSTLTVFAAALISTVLLTYPLGIAGLSWRAGLSITEAFMVNLAYIPLDLVKIVLTAIVATAVHRAFPMLLPARARR